MSQNAQAGKTGTPKSSIFSFGLGSTKNAGAPNVQQDLSRRNNTIVAKKSQPQDEGAMLRR
jgi:hypothetical protein